MEKRDETFLNPAATFLASILLVVMLGIVDWSSGYRLQFFVFYFIPIALSGWACGQKRSYIVGVASAGIWFAADFFSAHPYVHFSYAVWNTLIRLIAFLAIGFTVGRIRALLQHERTISDQLEKTLSEIKMLTGLLPICAGCKKIRNDAGYWQQIEEYIEKHSNAQFTHGLCQECAAKFLEEAGIKMDLPEQPPSGDVLNAAHVE